MALGVLDALFSLGTILLMIFFIVIFAGVIIWILKLIFSKPIHSIQRDAVRDLKHDASIQNQYGLKNLMLSGDKTHPPVYFGKTVGVIPNVPYALTKTKGEFKTVEKTVGEDIILVRVKDNFLFGWIPVIGDMFREDIILRLLPEEHSPFVMGGDLTVYAVGIKRLGNSGYYLTTNRNIPDLLKAVFDQSFEYAIKQNVDALGVMANKIVEANSEHVKTMEKQGGIVKIISGPIEKISGEEQQK